MTTPPDATAAERDVRAARNGDPAAKRNELDAFEEFYKDVRGRLLLQTWALTGDLPAAQKAVRDALVIAWHHWRKVRRLSPSPAGSSEREDWVRPIAWSHATRRHQVPHLPRNRNVDPEIRRTLTALAKLTPIQRKTLLLTHLTTIPLDAVAREVGVPAARAETDLLAAMTALTTELELVSSDEIRGRFAPMAAEVEKVRWPRPTILTRQGSARRRIHAGVGVAVAAVAFVGSGFAVAGDRHDTTSPTLGGLSWVDAPGDLAKVAPYQLPLSALLTTDQLGIAAPLASHSTSTSTGLASSTAAAAPAWTVALTGDDRATKATDDAQLPCQQASLADPKARGALVRTFSTGDDTRTAGQLVEMSSTTAAAKAGYSRALTWYAGCSQSRTQLVGTYDLTGVGDQATLIRLVDWAHHGDTVDVAVARTGVITTTVSVTAPASHHATSAQPSAALLAADAVNGLCHEPDAGACATTPAETATSPVAVGADPAMLSEVDLPPVAGIHQPWVGTDPAAATTNVAATHCDQTSFDDAGISHAKTRSFVIPTDKSLPTEFGLTETIGRFVTHDAAYAFTSQVESKMATCEKRELGSHVAQLSPASKSDHGIALWRVQIEVSRSRTVTYLMALIRHGDAVAQVGFVPSDDATISTSDFAALAERAQQRLTTLP